VSQSATLYSISATTFLELKDGGAQSSLLKIARSYQTFYCFEGFRFLLPKIVVDTDGVTNRIFYADTAMSMVDRPHQRAVHLPEEEEGHIFYNSPEVVKEIAALLGSIKLEEVQNAFDPVELNEKKIYPYGAWNNNSGREWSFNLDHFTKEFSLLQKFYSLASEEEDYLLSFTG
jgi:hypothetical protein